MAHELPTQQDIQDILEGVNFYNQDEGDNVQAEWTGGIYRTETGQLWISFWDGTVGMAYRGWTTFAAEGEEMFETIEELINSKR